MQGQVGIQSAQKQRSKATVYDARGLSARLRLR